jgi:hypothetical protein
MEAEVHTLIKKRLGTALDLLYPSDRIRPVRPASPAMPLLPEFPWPPPASYSRVAVPHELFATPEKSTLHDVYKTLVGALEAASPGFEHGLFIGPPDGFALVARMERVKRDGTPFPEPVRWMKAGSPKLSLADLLADLFFENPGYFRIIVFAVTNNILPGEDARARVPEPVKGAPTIPPALAVKPFKDQELLALIYAFERGRDAKITPWKDGAPSAKQHLQRAGIWTSLTATSGQSSR